MVDLIHQPINGSNDTVVFGTIRLGLFEQDFVVTAFVSSNFQCMDITM